MNVTHQVALADDAFELLRTLKRPDESFSDVVRRLADTARLQALRDVAGSLKASKEEVSRLKEEVYAARRAARFRKVDL